MQTMVLRGALTQAKGLFFLARTKAIFVTFKRSSSSINIHSLISFDVR
jgi:hypothetical protein